MEKKYFVCLILIAILIILFVSPIWPLVSAAPLDKKDNLDQAEKQITLDDLQKLKNEVTEIRRDQLNYQIEKDLLKETYSSNYQTINLIISLILAVFVILGYLGVKSIASVKKEYADELEKLRRIKESFEEKLNNLISKQSEVEAKLTSILHTNEEQSIKIKTLELKEKAIGLADRKNYQRALEYIAIVSENLKDDVELLSLKGKCLYKLRNFAGAVEVHKQILAIEPNNEFITRNLAELYLIEQNTDSYDELLKAKKEYLAAKGDVLIPYLESVKYYVKNDAVKLKTTISDFVGDKELDVAKKLIDWDFAELVDGLLARKENDPKKTLLLQFIRYLKGDICGSDMKKALGKI